MQLSQTVKSQARPVSPLVTMVEEAADAVGWQAVEPFRWLGRSALLQRGRSRLAVAMPRREVTPEETADQAARLRAHSVRGLWLVPPTLPSATGSERHETPTFALLDGRVSAPGHNLPVIADFVKGALNGRLKWVVAPCPSVYGLWVVSTDCPSCRARQEFPAGALWLRGATYDQKRLGSPPPANLVPLDPDGIDEVRSFMATLTRPAALSRDHLGIAAHCAHCGCILPKPSSSTGDLHVTSVSAPIIERGWWTWDEWPRPAVASPLAANEQRNYTGHGVSLN